MTVFDAARRGDLQQLRQLLLSESVQDNGADQQGDRAARQPPSAVTGGGAGSDDAETDASAPTGVSVNAIETKHGRTALLEAVANGHLAAAELLLQHGADAMRQDDQGMDALMLACSLPHQVTNIDGLVSLLLSHNANLDNVNKTTQSALHLAAKWGRLQAVKLILENPKGKKVINAKSTDGKTAVAYAAEAGHATILALLCAQGANVSIADVLGNTALHWAARSGEPELVQTILSSGADVEARTTQGLTAICIAAALGKTLMVQELLVHGAYLETLAQGRDRLESDPGCNPRTAMILAACNGHISSTQLLLFHKLVEQQCVLGSLVDEVTEAREVARLGCHDSVYQFLDGVLNLSNTMCATEAKAELQFSYVCKCNKCSAYNQNGTQENHLNCPAPHALMLLLRDENEAGVESSAEAQAGTLGQEKTENQSSSLRSSPASQTTSLRVCVNSPVEREDTRLSSRVAKRREKAFDPLKILDPQAPGIKTDILRIIGTYLQSEGFVSASLTLQDEAQIKLQERSKTHDQVRHVFKLITRGEWAAISKLVTKEILGRNNRRFLYAMHKQEYLELISRGENERALSYLYKKLKPLEAQSETQGNKSEFADLCYLLTCKSVHDAASFRNWDVTTAREKLAEEFESMATSDYSVEESSLFARPRFIEKDRLIHLLQQAFAYQLEFSSTPSSGVTPHIDTLLDDYECIGVPRALDTTFVGHQHSVKCALFLGEEGAFLASGSSDRKIILWRVQDEHEDLNSDEKGQEEHNADELVRRGLYAGSGRQGDDEDLERTQSRSSAPGSRCSSVRQPEVVLTGHKSRIWDLTSGRSGRWLCSASGDNTVRLWDVSQCLEKHEEQGHSNKRHLLDPNVANEPVSHEIVNAGHEGDIYGVELHYDEVHLATAGYDKTARLVDLRTNQVIKSFYGHSSAVTQVKFNPLGNLIISVSKDSTIKFWDAISGVCVKTFYQPIGEVTSLDVSRDGLQILTSSKDSSIRLWDVRTGRTSQRFGGYQNSSLNFVRAVFGPREAIVFSGSEDGKVYSWDTHSGNMLAKLRGHNGPVFHTAWSSSQSLLASCSEDGTVRTWKAH